MHKLSAAEIFGRDSSFWRYKVCADIRSGSLERRYWGHDHDLLGLRDIMGHMTIGLAMYGFLQVVNLNRPSISHDC